MLAIPNKSSIMNFEFFDDNILTEKDHGKEIIDKWLNGRPCIGEFEPISWSVWALKQEIHDTLSEYQLFQKTEMTDYGLDTVRYIDFFGDADAELYFKLKYLNC